ncbi:transposase family protein [Nocardia sp. CC227C]|uniref:transposase family protein n=1 Tax=Nocardia sp. CC227C TaxID=3044562 RepID=UPI00278C02FD|nr:transposase family protein [Nocardia sp. CC227C]
MLFYRSVLSLSRSTLTWVSGVITLGDKGYQGATALLTPYKGKDKPASQQAAYRAHALLRSRGERAIAQLESWRVLAKLLQLQPASTNNRLSHPVDLTTGSRQWICPSDPGGFAAAQCCLITPDAVVPRYSCGSVGWIT